MTLREEILLRADKKASFATGELCYILFSLINAAYEMIALDGYSIEQPEQCKITSRNVLIDEMGEIAVVGLHSFPKAIFASSASSNEKSTSLLIQIAQSANS